MPDEMGSCLRTVLWRNDRFHMYEYCSLKSTNGGDHFEGAVVTTMDGQPVRILYQVGCDAHGLTHSTRVDVVGGLGEQHIQLEVDGQRTWRWNGREMPECQGCADVDLGFSPATNSLPIRRLNLPVNESQTLKMAWVRFPQLDVIAYPQRYTRLGEDRYLYESLLSDFKAELVVDDQGIVRQYGEYWKAVATGQEC